MTIWSETCDTGNLESRARISLSMLSWVGERCWITTNAMPGLRGSAASSATVASNPPADAPMATTGNGGPTSPAECSTAALTPGFTGTDFAVLPRGRAGVGFLLGMTAIVAQSATSCVAREPRHPPRVTPAMPAERIVVIGASAGGVKALRALARELPAPFPAPLLVVQHVGNHRSILPELLSNSGGNRAAHAVDGERATAGRIHVAPPDHHLLLAGEHLRVMRGAKEHHSRPAIDPLFRSAAASRGPGVIGVVLTGNLDDGTAGLQAIKSCGGIAVVQDPDDAEVPSMPSSALRYVDVDHRVALAGMGALLAELATAPIPQPAATPVALEEELEAALGLGDPMEHLAAIGKPSTFTCPDCGGSLWALHDARPPRFRCHSGHAFTLRSLMRTQDEATDAALWSGLRALQEKHHLLDALAESHERAGDVGEAQELRRIAAQTRTEAETLRNLIDAPALGGLAVGEG
jgi:two-component system chemotaxis response regulator CheB